MNTRDGLRSLLLRMARLGVQREDLEESFTRGSGHGGQKINKTSSCVILKHPPSGLVLRCQAGRSLAQNRIAVRELLCEKLEARQARKTLTARAALAKKRAQTRQRSKGQKAAMVRDKRLRSDVKASRRRPVSE
jgi:peptide chain release factor